jgi:diacylglycerol kinase (ATP)
MEGGRPQGDIQRLTTQEIPSMAESVADPGLAPAASGPVLALVNPVSGGGRGAGVWLRVGPSLREVFPRLDLEVTEGSGLAETLAARWARREPDGLLLVVGGDGTVHEAVNGLLAGGSAGVVLAVVPAGTGNDFARSTGVPLDPAAAAERHVRQVRAGIAVRRMDVGRLTFRDRGGAARTRHFLNSVSVGVSPRANRIAQAMRGVVPGRLRYPLGGVAAVLSGGAVRYRVTQGGEVRFEGEALNLTIANGPTFGGGLRISPGSSLTDGVLEQVIIGRLGVARALTALGRLYGGTHVGMRGVSVTPVREALTIEVATGAMLAEADGQEFELDGPLTVEPVPGGLTLLA